MPGLPTRARAIVPVLVAAGLFALYAGALRTGFLNDDYLFLESARSGHLLDSLARLDALGNFYRPLSRQLYFALLTPLAGGSPRVFHLVNFALFLAALALLADLLGVFSRGMSRLAGVVFFALLPFQRVNLIWISCAQDLMALVGSLGALALWRRDRRLPAIALAVASFASKETALVIPAALVGWDLLVAGRPWRDASRRARPLLVAWGAWIVWWLSVRARSTPQDLLHFDPLGFPATFVHLVQSLLGLEDPAGFASALARSLPAWLPLALLAGAGLLALETADGAPAKAQDAGAGADGAAARGIAPARAGIRFALLWIALFTVATWPVVRIWSGYYYTLAAAGAALLVAIAVPRLDRVAWVVACAALLWWNAAGSGGRAFAVRPGAWGTTSHLTSFYFERGAALTDSMSRSLVRIEPSPPAHARFFFATLPSYAGFQMGNGALIRNLYRDSTLASYFYSQYGDSTADDRPCRFFYWNGVALQPLYPGVADPFFQVGCDLLLLDRPAGAAFAFRRALSSGGVPQDDLYWFGWASLWSGDRRSAEAAWSAMGARDSLEEHQRLFVGVRNLLEVKHDTLAARRQLMQAIRLGIGIPHAHAVLGELLLARGGIDRKYGLLELLVATRLNAKDLLAHRELAAGLADIGLWDAARRELATLEEVHPDWPADSAVVALDRRLRERDGGSSGVIRFE